MTIQIIETQTVHRIYYAINTKEPLNQAQCYELLISNQLEEMTQKYVGEQIIGMTNNSLERFKVECKRLEVLNPPILNLDIPSEKEVLDETEVSIMGEIPE